MAPTIEWLGHAAFRITGDGKVIYIDPYELARPEPAADLILVSHAHDDHFSDVDLERLRTATTAIVGPAEVAEELAGCVVLSAGDERVLAGVRVTAVPAYNVDKFNASGRLYHPKGDGIGFVVEVSGQRIYHAGDSDEIPEMAGLSPDVALVPVSGTYVMSAEEAAQALRSIRPKLAIPMHYGSVIDEELVGSEADAQRLLSLAEVPVQILPRSV